MNVAHFPPPGLQAQLDELRRERTMRAYAYPRMIAARKLTQIQADFHNCALDAAIGTLERLVEFAAGLRIGAAPQSLTERKREQP